MLLPVAAGSCFELKGFDKPTVHSLPSTVQSEQLPGDQSGAFISWNVRYFINELPETKTEPKAE